jgi:hypothetical protein
MNPSLITDRNDAASLLGFNTVHRRLVRFGEWYVVRAEARRVPLRIALPRPVLLGFGLANKPSGHEQPTYQRVGTGAMPAMRGGYDCGKWGGHRAS